MSIDKCPTKKQFSAHLRQLTVLMSHLIRRLAKKGRLIAFAFFCLTFVQLILQTPYVVILVDERAQVFSATLCILTLFITILSTPDRKSFASRKAVWISVIIASIVILSSAYSHSPRQSLERAYVILSAGLGGYWCSRLLLGDPILSRMFQWLVCGLLVTVIFLSLLGLYLTGRPHEFLDSHWHPVGSRLLLLSFAPLSLALGQNRRNQITGWIILIATLLTIYIVGRYAFIESILVIPGIISVVALLVFRGTGVDRRVLWFIIVITVTTGIFFVHYNPKNLDRSHISVAYRVESMFCSLDIARIHPWLGNGLWAPRDSYLENRQLRYPFVSKELFSEWVKRQRTSENLYLTFLADLGIPFTILYFGSVLYLLLKLVRLSRYLHPNLVFHPASILLPLLAECLRFLIVDDLFHPQLSWFFHILLGLIPLGVVKSDKDSSAKISSLD